MAAIFRGLQPLRALRCPRCRQPWLPERRRLLSMSSAVLQGPAGGTVAPPGNPVADRKRSTKGSSSLRERLRSKGDRKTDTGSKGGMKGVRRILGQTPDRPIRTRFAPSPTGYLHLGSLRTALFNNLSSSASAGGAFIIRIEDTDQSRLVHDAEERILHDLKWLGLEWSEGPDCGGPHGPYRQSERLGIYRDHVQQLIDRGYAYRCFCKPEDLDKQKLELHEAGRPTLYPGTCRSVHADESAERAAAGEPHVVRFRGDAFGILGHKDAIYGPFQKKEPEEDFIIFKTDGFPTYHLANVVDDHLMEITHVVRGEEWLISTPKHLALYKAFGWEPPTFAHLGLLVNEDGSKLSKRNASANVSKYQQDNYSPMAMQAWLANLGSSFKPGYDATPRTLKDVAEALSFKFTKGGIKLNPSKLDGFDVKYHRAIMLDPLPDLSAQEGNLLSQLLLEPMLGEVERLTGPAPDTFRHHSDASWEQPKDLVPALSSPATRTPYLSRMFGQLVRTRYKKRGDMQRLVLAHPHYFWRVQPDLYRQSLVGRQRRDLPALDALDHVCSREPQLWDSGDPAVVSRAFLEFLAARGVSEVEAYAQHRLVATGRMTAFSHSASDLFAIMGRDEWIFRNSVVSRILDDLVKEGSL